ncbi:hypothetical protein [Bradyrhizobium sp. AUGA SZCCT0182]|uniref:hypothetical protein n=1 Tax=Bradyrhizobium sp. AUGA SZCCT0182 TaxID=2807667 RepID=UPI001BA8A60B|nr:hypothetical protein [Bradyrhizobium sp. AUGA SZCCT0182]MBR1232034.1 hypothetical protein [Bradyrhizobium sp. AUGA SZCCT0182]
MIGRDVVRGHMLDGDVLLATAPMVVQSLCEHHHRLGRLVGQLQFALRNTPVAAAHLLVYIASEASLAAINCAISMPSTGAAAVIASLFLE